MKRRTFLQVAAALPFCNFFLPKRVASKTAPTIGMDFALQSSQSITVTASDYAARYIYTPWDEEAIPVPQSCRRFKVAVENEGDGFFKTRIIPVEES